MLRRGCGLRVVCTASSSQISYVHRSSESPRRFQTKKLFRDFALENFLPKTVKYQTARSLESRSDSEEEGFSWAKLGLESLRDSEDLSSPLSQM